MPEYGAAARNVAPRVLAVPPAPPKNMFCTTTLLFLIVVALGNLALGYFLAVRFGDVFTGGTIVPYSGGVSGGPLPAPVEHASIAPIEPVAPPKPAASPAAPTPPVEEPVYSAPDVVVDDPTRQEAPTDAGIPSEEPGDLAPTDVLTPPPNEKDNQKAVETLRTLQQGTDEYRHDLEEIDRRVRDCSATPTSGAAEQCANDLKEAGRKFVEHQTPAMEQLAHTEGADRTPSDEHTFRAARAMIEEAQHSVDRLEETDLSEENLEQYCRQLLAETTLQIQQCQSFSTEMEECVEELIGGGDAADEDDSPSRQEDPEDTLEPAADAAKPPSARAALEQAIQQWTTASERQIPLTVAVLDVDEFTALGEQVGEATTAKILDAISEIVTATVAGAGTLFFTSGQQYWLTFEGTETRNSATVIEKTRQTVQNVRFRHGEESLQVTISAGLADAEEDDTASSLLQRLVSTVREAKRYGRNRTFIFRNEYPAPVVPPSITIEDQTIAL